MDERLITVTGYGTIHVVPDITRIELSLVSLHDTYDAAYAQAKADVDRLQNIMKAVELSTDIPKTMNLDIEKKTRSEYDKNDHYKGKIFLGFELNHKIKIDLGMDTVLLNNVIKLIGKKIKQAEIKIGYTVKNPRASQLILLERAVKDAMDKATIMAQACGCALGPVKKINSSFSELHELREVHVRDIHDADEAMSCSPTSLDIKPDDLTLSDDVEVVWYLADAPSHD